MRQMTPAEIADHGRADMPDPLAVHTTIDGDVETIEVASGFAILGPAEELQSDAAPWWRRVLDGLARGW